MWRRIEKEREFRHATTDFYNQRNLKIFKFFLPFFASFNFFCVNKLQMFKDIASRWEVICVCVCLYSCSSLKIKFYESVLELFVKIYGFLNAFMNDLWVFIVTEEKISTLCQTPQIFTLLLLMRLVLILLRISFAKRDLFELS